MKITRLTVSLVAALLATACASTESRPEVSAARPVAASEEAAVATDETAAATEEAPRYSRRRGCPNGYTPTGTRVKRCTNSGILDVRNASAEALGNALSGQGAAGGGSGGEPPQG